MVALPSEVIRLILQQIRHTSTTLGGSHDKESCACEKSAASLTTTRTLLSACLVARAWRNEAQSILYASINCTQQQVRFGTPATSHADAPTGVDIWKIDNAESDESESEDGSEDSDEESSLIPTEDSDQKDDESAEGLNDEVEEMPESEANEDTDSDEEESDSGDDLGSAGMTAASMDAALAMRYPIDACAGDMSSQLEALQRTLSGSPRLASNVKNLAITPDTDQAMSILAFSPQVEEICFANGRTGILSDKLTATVLKLQKLKRCQLHAFEASLAYRILAALIYAPSLEALRMSNFGWQPGEDLIETKIIPQYSMNIHALVLDKALLPTAHFQSLLSHIVPHEGAEKLEVRLHDVAWAEEDDTYSPFQGLSDGTASSITTLKLHEASLEAGDFRGIERLTSLHTLGIFGSIFDGEFNAAVTAPFPTSLHLLQLGYNESASEDDYVPVISVVDTWIRQGKFPGLKTISVMPGDFGRDDFEQMCNNSSYDEVSEEIQITRKIVQSFQSMLDAHRLDCNIRPMADFQRFLDHTSLIWMEGQPWKGILEDRIEDLRLSGTRYRYWKG